MEFVNFSLEIEYSCGERYLGGFIGSDQRKDEWMHAKVERWVQDVKLMAQVAMCYPQEAYIGFVLCKQAEWQYVK